MSEIHFFNIRKIQNPRKNLTDLYNSLINIFISFMTNHEY